MRARNARAMRLLASGAALAFAGLAMPGAAHAQFQCSTDPAAPGDNRTCVNTGLETLQPFTNETNAGGAATTINNGTSQALHVFTTGGGDATIINTGVIDANGFTTTAQAFGVGANARIRNLGTGNGLFSVVSDSGEALFYNGGSIYGYVELGANTFGTAVLTNAGVLHSPSASGFAINFEFNDLTFARSTLNIEPGSRIIGIIYLAGTGGGPPTAVNFRSGADISSVTTFGGNNLPMGGLSSPSQVQVSGGAPYVISGHTVAILDPTSFGMQDRNLVDVTRTISSMVT
ncbi:MAG: hypothetical protein Q7J60_18305, partial [Bradyrhizobium sp.]|nr:hypothetical protein [Bradyrhizobium sp.]